MHITLSSALSVSFQKMDASHSLYREMSWKKVYKSHFYWGPHVYGAWSGQNGRIRRGGQLFELCFSLARTKRPEKRLWLASDPGSAAGSHVCGRSECYDWSRRRAPRALWESVKTLNCFREAFETPQSDRSGFAESRSPNERDSVGR